MFAQPLLFIIAFLISLSVHEAAHAWMANRLGDPTARLAGRQTLNPLAHLDPLGALLVFFLLFTGSPIIFGWGKPVPFDPFNLRSPRRDSALISFAGPAANLILAALLAVIVRLTNLPLIEMIVLNITWAFFNLLPLHPLDGGKVLIGLLPQELAPKWDEILHQYGLIILIFLIFPFGGTSPLFLILRPLVSLALKLLLPGMTLV
jgi:Zn-dependent protease